MGYIEEQILNLFALEPIQRVWHKDKLFLLIEQGLKDANPVLSRIAWKKAFLGHDFGHIGMEIVLSEIQLAVYGRLDSLFLGDEEMTICNASLEHDDEQIEDQLEELEAEPQQPPLHADLEEIANNGFTAYCYAVAKHKNIWAKQRRRLAAQIDAVNENGKTVMRVARMASHMDIDATNDDGDRVIPELYLGFDMFDTNDIDERRKFYSLNVTEQVAVMLSIEVYKSANEFVNLVKCLNLPLPDALLKSYAKQVANVLKLRDRKRHGPFIQSEIAMIMGVAEPTVRNYLGKFKADDCENLAA